MIVSLHKGCNYIYFHCQLMSPLFLDQLLSCLVNIIPKDINQHFLKSKVTSLQVLFCPQPKDIQFTLKEEQGWLLY